MFWEDDYLHKSVPCSETLNFWMVCAIGGFPIPLCVILIAVMYEIDVIARKTLEEMRHQASASSSDCHGECKCKGKGECKCKC